MTTARREPIAVVGMACRFPGGDTPDAFWEFLARGGDAVTEIPPERWDVDAYYDPDPNARGKMYTRWGAFIPDFDRFSASFFGISPREAQYMDPQQRQLLEVHWEALENAGIVPRRLVDQQVGIFVGMGTTDYGDLQAALGAVGADAYNGTGGSHAAAAGRLSYLLGVRGPSLAIDTACSSSLVSVHLAINSLRCGESDIALASGVNLNFAPDVFIGLCKAKMLSPDGHCKTFDARANGYVRGEGCGVLVLKRLSDAMADGDNILALLRGSATNHNGRSSGLTVPSGPAQQEVIRTALRNGGVEPSDIGFLEAHGTGTAVGDPIEAGALGAVFAGRPTPLLVGSVKTNCGHLEWAAGVCGLVKTILSMDRGVIPPNLHFEQPNPMIPWDRLPLRIVTEPTPWPEGPRVSGVSSFGFGGTNAHVVVEQAPVRSVAKPAIDRPLHLLALSARSETALRSLADRMAEAADRLPQDGLADLCYSANTGRSCFDHRLAVAATTLGDLAANLRGFSGRVSAPALKSGREPHEAPLLAMMFTGQGSQRPGMGRELFETQADFRGAIQECDALLRGVLDRPLLEVLFAADAEAAIDETGYTQPALFAVEYALARLWASWGVVPDVVLGHSVGEYVAACVAGVFDLTDALKLIAARGALMQGLPRDGAMLSVRAAEDKVLPFLEGWRDSISIAAVNSPGDTVVSGEAAAIEAIAAAFERLNVPTTKLKVSHAFHSPLMEPIIERFAAVAASVRFQPPRLVLISNVTGREAGEEIATPDYWVRHVREAVRFADSIRTAGEMGCRHFVEAGPQPVLCSLGRQTLEEEEDALWLPSLNARRGDWAQMLDSASELWAHGRELDWTGFDRDRPRRKIPLPTYPFERERFWFPAGAGNGVQRVSALRPLVETLSRSPLVKETVASATFGALAQPYLAEHKVHGQIVVPGAAYLSMLASASELLGWPAFRLDDVYFLAPLVLPERDGRAVQAVLTPVEAEGRAPRAYGAQIVALPADGADGVAPLMSARLSRREPGMATGSDLANLQARCRRPFDRARLYELIDSSGVETGPSFRWVDKLWLGDNEALAALSLPEAAGELDGYRIHPALLDAGFQVAGALLGEDEQNETLLPFAVKAMRQDRPATGSRWWCHAVRTGSTTWDVCFLDEAGAFVMLEGFEMRRAPAAAFMRRRLADWLYRIEWRPSEPPAEPREAAEPATWILLDNGSSLGADLSARLAARGDRCLTASEGRAFASHDDGPSGRRFTINPTIPEDFRKLIAATAEPGQPPCRGVIHLWSVAPATANGDSADQNPAARAETLAVSLLHMVQAAVGEHSKPRPWVVTSGAESVLPGEAPRPEQAALWGMARTLPQEAPDLHIGCIDVGPEAAADADCLLAEFDAAPGEGQTAYRDGRRYVARVVHSPEAVAPTIDGPFRLQLNDYGSPDNLQLAPMTRQKPGRNQVEIGVKAAALNFRDVVIALGMLKEFYAQEMGIARAQDIWLGFDCAGVVTAVGDDVTDIAVGEAVMAPAVGSMASHVVAFRDGVMRVPEGFDFVTAASLPSVYWTAYHALVQLARIRPGERVLIHAAAGGVGLAAVQIAQALGAEIFATASPGKWDYLRSQGVIHIMNSRTLDFAEAILRETQGAGVDVVLNSLGGEAVERSFQVLKPGGRFIEIGRLGGGIPEEATRRPDVAWFTFELGAVIARDPLASIRTGKEICALFESGAARPMPVTVFSMDNAAEAYRFMQQTRHIGKVVLSLSESTVRTDASYLITGGLGGLGVKVAESLVESGARHLVLAGRNGPGEEAERAIAAMRERGASVEVVRGDIAHPEDAAAMVERCQRIAPLRGVIHAAGVLREGLVQNQNAASFTAVMAPKVRGAWALHQLTRELPLDFFVSFSSMASLTGSPGQTNYAAANAFLDALATLRRTQGLAGSSINWGPWGEIGMAAPLEFGAGIDKLSVEEGLLALRALLKPQRGGRGDVGVLKMRWDAYVKRWPAPEAQSFLSALVSRGDPAAAAPDAILKRLRAAPGEARRGLVEAHIHEAVRQVLNLGGGYEIKNGLAWTDLGVDSLMMVEIKNRLEGSLKLVFPIELLMRDVCVDSVAEFVLAKLDFTSAEPPATPAAAPEDLIAIRSEIRESLLAIPQAYATVEEQRGRHVLVDGRWRHDFASCNYLGFDLEPRVAQAVSREIERWGTHPSWTRAVASPSLYAELERELADMVGAPETLVFPSISLLHLGVLPVLAGGQGVILTDAAAHYSIAEACMRAQADGTEWVEFRHNDIEDLTRKLARYPKTKTKIIATDGVYSMGSPNPPLAAYAALAREHDAILYVDDAHGFGIIGAAPDENLPYGHGGNGVVRHLGLDYDRDRVVYVAGLSKAFSSYAAFVTCPDEKTKRMLQTSGPYVFSGPTAVACLASALAGLRLNREDGDDRRIRIHRLTRRLVREARAMGFEIDNDGDFPIVGVVIGDMTAMVAACRILWDHDILITPATFPAVPATRNLVRFSITAANTDQEVDRALEGLHAIRAAANGARIAQAAE